MIASLIIGIIVGFGLSIPPGPIAVSIIKHSLGGNHRDAYSIALGASSMDVIFTMMAAFASSAIVVSLMDLITTHAWLKVLFQVICIGILTVLSIKYFRANANLDESTRLEQKQEKKAKQMGVSAPVLVGILLAIMNLATPTFLPGLVFLISYLHANPFTSELLGDTVAANAMLSLGFGLGAMAWLSLLGYLMSHFKNKLPPHFIRYIYLFAAGAFALFAAILAYNVLTSTDWSDIW